MGALLALFLRSLRVEARSRLTYGLRATLGLIVLLVILAVHQKAGWRGAPGLKIFIAVIALDLFVISLAGLSYFASAIAEEKEEMTLGLLRMTDLSALSILFGKSTSRLIGALLLLAAQTPFTLLAVALGGVTAPQVLAAYTTLGAYLFLLANLALVFSVIAARTSTATFFAGCGMALFWSGSHLIKGAYWVLGRLGIFASRTPGPALGEFLDQWWSVTPAPRLEQIMQTGFYGSAWCSQVAVSLTLGVGFFLLAWALFQRGADRAIDPEPARLFVPKAKSWRGPGGGRAWKHALVWKDFHFLSGGKIAFAARCVVGLAIAAYFAWDSFLRPAPAPITPASFSVLMIATRVISNRTGMPWFDFGNSLTRWLWPLLWLELMFAASRVFRLERRWQTLSSLAVLPMSMHRVAGQKILGSLLGALPWIILVGLGYAIQAPETWNSSSLPAGIPAGTFVWSRAWFSVMSYVGFILLLHLVAALSLRLKWGALPLGFVGFYILQMFALIFAALVFQQASPVVVALVEGFAIVVLHARIGRRLEELTEED